METPKLKGHNQRTLLLRAGFAIAHEERLYDLKDEIMYANYVRARRDKCEADMKNELNQHEVVGWALLPKWELREDDASMKTRFYLTASPIVRKYAPPPP